MPPERTRSTIVSCICGASVVKQHVCIVYSYCAAGGKRIFDALFHDLFTAHGLTRADELLFAGCSAGALTTYTHADYVTELMKTSAPQAKVLALADAMFSLHHNGYPANPNNYYTGQFVWGFTAWNSSGAVDASCLASFPESDRWMCFHGAIAAKFVTTPLLVVNSK